MVEKEGDEEVVEEGAIQEEDEEVIEDNGALLEHDKGRQ
jgi:hypothetical protein